LCQPIKANIQSRTLTQPFPSPAHDITHDSTLRTVFLHEREKKGKCGLFSSLFPAASRAEQKARGIIIFLYLQMFTCITRIMLEPRAKQRENYKGKLKGNKTELRGRQKVLFPLVFFLATFLVLFFSLLIHGGEEQRREQRMKRKTLFISCSFFTLRVIVTEFMNNADTLALPPSAFFCSSSLFSSLPDTKCLPSTRKDSPGRW
jgi:hypothetical protein